MAFTDQGAYLDTSERVHIGGTGDPSVSLKVTGEVYVTSNITAYYSSDITLKDNVRPIESALFKIQQIRGVEFDWNEKSTKLQQEKGHDVGLIAQEVEKVLPEVIQIREGGIKAVSYEKVIPLLVEAIKEQQKQIDELKNVSLGYKKLLEEKEQHFNKKQKENKIKEKFKKDGLVISKYGK